MGKVIYIDKDGNALFADKDIKKQIATIRQQTATIGTQKVIKPPKIAKRKEVNNPLTEEHRDEVRYLVSLWVDTSKNAKSKRYHVGYPQAWSNLYCYGLSNEVNGIEQIEESEYVQCKKYLNIKIRIAVSNLPKGKELDTPEIRHRTIGAIHARCKQLGITDEVRKAYQLYHYGKESLSDPDFSMDELQQFYRKLMGPNPKLTIKKKTTQQQREAVLQRLLGRIEGEAASSGKEINLSCLDYSRNEIEKLLNEMEPELFRAGFDGFWSKQKLCHLKHGVDSEKKTKSTTSRSQIRQ